MPAGHEVLVSSLSPATAPSWKPSRSLQMAEPKGTLDPWKGNTRPLATGRTHVIIFVCNKNLTGLVCQRAVVALGVCMCLKARAAYQSQHSKPARTSSTPRDACLALSVRCFKTFRSGPVTYMMGHLYFGASAM